MRLEGWHLLVVLAIVLLLFGAPRLPALARSIGQSMKIFRSEVKDPAKAEAEPPTERTGEATAKPATPAPATSTVDDEAATRRSS